MMKDIGYFEVLLFGLDTWKSLASLQIVASVSTFAHGDGSQPTLGHSQTCRQRILAEVAKDPDMRCEFESHESRKMKYMEKVLEQEDQMMKDSGDIPQPQSAPTQGATMTSSSSSSSSSRASSSTSSQADDDVPSADTDSDSKRKRGGK